MVKRDIENIFLMIFLIFILLIIPMASAGFWSDFKARITGELTSADVDINITVTAGTAPTVPIVRNDTMTNLSVSGPNDFTAYDADGYDNLDDSSALINFSKTGEETRENASCAWLADYDTNYSNYTCNVSMWWWDGTGTWDITAYIADLSANDGSNSSYTFYIGTTTGVVASPTNLSFPSVSPGATDSLSTNDPMLFNNTGNLDQYLEVNSTNLLGEDNASFALYASNFTVNTADACEGTAMQDQNYVNITGANLSAGNYTPNNGTAQEQLYFCLELAGPELIAQAYSTSATDSWTAKIVTV
jgi:hypothetical protein